LAKNKKMRAIERPTQTIMFRNKTVQDEYDRYQLKIDDLLSEHSHKKSEGPFVKEDYLGYLIDRDISSLKIWDAEKKVIYSKIKVLSTILSASCMESLISKVKWLLEKRNEYSYDPYNYHHDNIMSFIICKKITAVDKKKLLEKIEQAYDREGIDAVHRHNMILSIEDGLFLYYDPYNTALSSREYNWAFPKLGSDKFEQRFIPIQPEDKEYHFKQFAHHLFNGVADVTIIHPETAEYFKWEVEQAVDIIDLNSKN
ncbi:hypothetical protein M8R20_21290, partial [Pseudomonas sp. R2.Fl]|nr:hypothetical protein [Pseudomonas sp. R2.Fl]